MKPIKGWAVIADGKILDYGQYPQLHIFYHRAEARQSVFFMKRDTPIKQGMKIVRVEIKVPVDK